MSLSGQRFAGLPQKWLEGFRWRHGLDYVAPQAQASDYSLPVMADGERVLLHVGCGHATINNIPLSGFRQRGWREIRLDTDPSVAPDIVGTMVAGQSHECQCRGQLK